MKIIKSILSLAIFGLLLYSCSQKGKVIIKGNILNSTSPKIDVLDNSNTNSQFPVHAIYPDNKGNFCDTIEIEKSGFFTLTYPMGYVNLYLNKNENIEMQILPNDSKTYFFGKGNFEKSKNINSYNNQLEEFIRNHFDFTDEMLFAVAPNEFYKYITELKKSIEKEDARLVKLYKPDEDFHKLKLKINNGFIEMICYQYQIFYSYYNKGKKWTPNAEYTKFYNDLVSDKVALMQEDNTYFNLITSMYYNEFSQNFEDEAAAKLGYNFDNFVKFLNKKRHSKVFNELILTDFFKIMYYQSDTVDFAKSDKQMVENITDSKRKDEIQEYRKKRYGLKVGKKQPNSPLVDATGKAFDWATLKGKPYVLVSYASYSPLILPLLNQQLMPLMQAYKGKVNFVFVNLDKDFEQFTKTNHNLLINIDAVKLYAKKGLNSVFASENYVNSYFLPSLILVDANGNVACQKVTEATNPFFSEAFVKHVK